MLYKEVLKTAFSFILFAIVLSQTNPNQINCVLFFCFNWFKKRSMQIHSQRTFFTAFHFRANKHRKKKGKNIPTLHCRCKQTKK